MYFLIETIASCRHEDEEMQQQIQMHEEILKAIIESEKAKHNEGN